MVKKIFLNIFLLLTVYVLPFYLLYHYQDSGIKVGKGQVPLLVVLLFGSFLLIYLHNEHGKQSAKPKWLWIFFEIIGILGLCYSAFVLALLFVFRDCCGF